MDPHGISSPRSELELTWLADFDRKVVEYVIGWVVPPPRMPVVAVANEGLGWDPGA